MRFYINLIVIYTAQLVIQYLIMRYLSMLLLLLISCKQSPTESFDGVRLIPLDQIVDRVKTGNFNYMYATFVNADGEAITKEQRSLLNKGLLGKDYYEDASGQIKEVRVRPITLEDKFVEIQRIEIASNPLARITMIDVDCKNLDQMYAEVERTDQDVRNNGGDMQSVDAENLQKVISAVTKCGWTEDHLSTIWLVLQHSDSDIMAYYFSDLKRLSEEGKIRKSSMALMEDRLLMYHGYKQIYGSQITGGGLYDLEDPANVNERRAAIGLGTIEEYIANWELNFDEELERMGE